MAQERLAEIPIEIAYMEFGERNIPAGLDSLVAGGADEIAVVPYFLFNGMHIREDIPAVLEQYKAANPDIKIKMGSPLGADPRLAEILADRIIEVI